MPIDQDDYVVKIRPGSTIPFAELHDFDFLSGSAEKLPTERAAEPQCLQFHFRRHP
jgi:hypothetical protein